MKRCLIFFYISGLRVMYIKRKVTIRKPFLTPFQANELMKAKQYQSFDYKNNLLAPRFCQIGDKNV